MTELSPEDISRAREMALPLAVELTPFEPGDDPYKRNVAEIQQDIANAMLAYSAAENERRDAEVAKALRLSKSEEEPEEQAPWMVEAEPEPMGPFSLTEAAAALMEMLDREFSKADKRAEAAEAKCDRLKGALEDMLKMAKMLIRYTSEHPSITQGWHTRMDAAEAALRPEGE